MKLRLTNLLPIGNIIGLLLALTAPLVAAGTNTFSVTGSMNMPRYGHKLILLDNGKVLAVTGDRTATNAPQNTAELYNPATGTWTFTGTPVTFHEGGSATLLANGEVLLAGGSSYTTSGSLVPTAAAELYDPSTGHWTATGTLPSARQSQVAVLLPNGQVLVAGGEDSGFSSLADAALYNPATGIWQPTASMNQPRTSPVAELLGNGTVLVAGGTDLSNGKGTNLITAEIYNPSTGDWTMTANMPTNVSTAQRQGALLANGDVLASRAGVFNPANGTWTAANGPLPFGIALVGPNTATALATGDVLLTGFHSTYNLTPSENITFLYNFATNSYTRAASMTASRYDDAATILPNGQVLVSGGYERAIGFGLIRLSSAELYTP